MKKIILIILIKLFLICFVQSQPILTLDPAGHKSVVSEIVFSNNEKYIITGSQDKTVKVWDINSGENIRTFRGYIDKEYQGTVNSISISPDDKFLAVGTMVIKEKSDNEYIGVLRVYDFNSGKILSVLKEHNYNINKVIFSKNGRYLASSSNDTNVIVWDVNNNFKMLHKLSFHKKGCYGISISNNEKYIATSSFDNSIAVWDIKSGKMLASKFNPHEQGVEQIEFSNDDSMIATSSIDGTIKF